MVTLGQAAAGALLGILWLLLLGGYSELAGSWGWFFVALLTLTFGLLHIHQKRPRRFGSSRLRGFDQRHLAPALWLVLVLTAAQLSWFVLFAELPAPVAMSNPSTADADQALFLVVAIVVAPLIEEFGFRLWCQTQLEELLHPTLAILGAALLFTAIHGTTAWYSHLLSGLCYGFALWLSGSIWLPILLHSVSNGIIALLDQSDLVRELIQHWSLNAGLAAGVTALLLTSAAFASAWYWSHLAGRFDPSQRR